MQEHHRPIPSAIVQQYKFNLRTQKPEESIATFIAKLRCLAEHCQFGQTLDEMLRDQLVCGIADSRVQCRLLTKIVLFYSILLYLTSVKCSRFGNKVYHMLCEQGKGHQIGM